MADCVHRLAQEIVNSNYLWSRLDVDEKLNLLRISMGLSRFKMEEEISKKTETCLQQMVKPMNSIQHFESSTHPFMNDSQEFMVNFYQQTEEHWGGVANSGAQSHEILEFSSSEHNRNSIGRGDSWKLDFKGEKWEYFTKMAGTESTESTIPSSSMNCSDKSENQCFQQLISERLNREELVQGIDCQESIAFLQESTEHSTEDLHNDSVACNMFDKMSNREIGGNHLGAGVNPNFEVKPDLEASVGGQEKNWQTLGKPHEESEVSGLEIDDNVQENQNHQNDKKTTQQQIDEHLNRSEVINEITPTTSHSSVTSILGVNFRKHEKFGSLQIGFVEDRNILWKPPEEENRNCNLKNSSWRSDFKGGTNCLPKLEFPIIVEMKVSGEQIRESLVPTRGKFEKWHEKETWMNLNTRANPSASLIDKRPGFGNWNKTTAYSSNTGMNRISKLNFPIFENNEPRNWVKDCFVVCGIKKNQKLGIVVIDDEKGSDVSLQRNLMQTSVIVCGSFDAQQVFDEMFVRRFNDSNWVFDLGDFIARNSKCFGIKYLQMWMDKIGHGTSSLSSFGNPHTLLAYSFEGVAIKSYVGLSWTDCVVIFSCMRVNEEPYMMPFDRGKSQTLYPLCKDFSWEMHDTMFVFYPGILKQGECDMVLKGDELRECSPLLFDFKLLKNSFPREGRQIGISEFKKRVSLKSMSGLKHKGICAKVLVFDPGIVNKEDGKSARIGVEYIIQQL